MKKWLVGLLAAGLCAAGAWATDYTLVESTDDLTAGSYVITGNNATDGAEPAMLAQTPDKNYFYPSNVSVSDKVISDPDDTLVWEVAEVSGGWTIHSAVGYVSYSGSGNTATATADVADSSTWTISVAEGVATVANKGTEDRKLQYNSGSPRFACYTSSQKLLKFYKAASGPVAFSIKLDPAEDFEVVQGKEASITATVKGAQGDVSYSWSVNGTPIDLAGNVYTVDSSEVGGPFEVACEASDGVSEPVSASVSYSVVDPPVITGDEYTLVTSADVLRDGTLVVLTDPDSANALQAAVASSVFSVVAVPDNVSGDVLTTDDASIVWKLVDDGSGNFSLYNEDAAKYAGHNGADSNMGRLQDDPFPNTISVGEDGLFVLTSIAADAKEAYRSLQYNYNNGKPRFAYYKGTQKNVRIYAAETGPAKFSIALDPAKYFEVEVGQEASISATAKNAAEGDVHYAWTVGGESAGIDSAVLGLDTSTATDELEVVCTATDGADAVATAKVSYKVVTPAVKYPVTIAEGIENGEIAVDKTEAEEGETVTVTATPAEGYALEKIFVNGVAISGTTFPMPAEAAEVGATFAEVKDFAELPFVAEDTPYSGPWKTATIDGLTSKGLGDDYKDGSAKLDSANDWIQVKFAGTPGSLSFGIKGNSISDEKPSTFVVQESADGEEWSVLETYATGGKLTGDRTDETLALSASSQFVRFFYQEKGAGNVGIYDVYISSGGPAKFSIALDPAKYFEVEVDAEAAITATPKNAEGVVTYSWSIGGTPVDATGAVLTLDTSKATEVLEVVCMATDGAGAEATAKVSYKVVAPAVKYPVTVASGIENGTVSVDVAEAAEGDTVTVTATPASGYKLDKIMVNGEAIGGNTFVMGAAAAEVSATFVESVGVTYTRIESMDDFEADAEYLVVAYKKDAFSSALKNELTGKRIALEEVEIVDNTVTTDDDSIAWTISAGAEGKYTLYNAAKGVYAAAPSGATANEAQLVSDGTAELAQWSISVAEEDPLVTIGSAHEGRSLQRNSTATYAYFANYANGAKPYLFKKGGTAKLSVSFDKSNGFTVPLGEASSITATAKNGQEPYTYVWDGDLEGEGATLAIPATLAEKDYTVQVTVTDGAGDKASKQIGFTVQAPVEKYAITVERVPGGTLAVDKDEAEAGETVTVTATPDPGMKLESITFNGTPISGKTFEMPAEAVTVSGTFVEATGDNYTLVTSADVLQDGLEVVLADPDAAYALSATVSSSVFGVAGVAPVEDVIVTDNAAIVWKLVADGNGNFSLYNEDAAKYAGHAGSDSNSGRLQDEAFPNTVALGEDGLFVVTSIAADAKGNYRSLQYNYNSGNPRFAYYKGTQKNLRIYAKSGAPAPKITYAGSTEITLGEAFSIQFALKNYDGTYSWAVQGDGSISAAGLYTYKPEAAGTVVIMVKALDGAGSVITQSEDIQLTVNEPGPGAPAVTCNLGESVTGSVGDEFEFVFTTENFTVAAEGGWYVELDGNEVGFVVSDDNQSATFSWAPEADGEYTIVATAFDENDETYDCTVAVTIGGGGSEGPEIGGQDVAVSGFNGKKFTGKVSDEVKDKYTGARLDYATELVGTEWNWSEDKVVGNAAEWPNLDFDYEALGLKYAVFRLVFFE